MEPSLCVCLCVCQLALSKLNCLTYFMKFDTRIDLDNTLDEFEGQGHRSKVKAIQCNFQSFGLGFLCDK